MYFINPVWQNAENILVWALSSERILTLLLALVVIGLGRWFDKRGWPDIYAWLKERNDILRRRVDLQHEREMEGTRLKAESERLQAAGMENLARAFRDGMDNLDRDVRELVGELHGSNAVQQTHTNLLVHILERINGRRVVDALTEEKDCGGRG